MKDTEFEVNDRIYQLYEAQRNLQMKSPRNFVWNSLMVAILWSFKTIAYEPISYFIFIVNY